ncbi:MAG: hypothetical protein ACHQT6_09210 [Candidatus Acidiferrales bacterium]
MIKVSGCSVLGLESVTLRPCGTSEPGDAIWVEDARFVQEMEKHRLPEVPDAMPKGLEKPAIKKELFTYEQRRNAEAWNKLKPSPDPEQTVVEVMLLGQFETVAQQVPPETQSGFGHLGAYSHELILADVLSNKPAQLSVHTEQTQALKAIGTTVCEIVEDPLRFVGKRVRFSASFVSDGIENSVLSDASCGRGIEPFVPDKVEQHPDIEALDRALGQGMRATTDKRIVAIFTGRFVVRDSYSSRLRFVLNIERIGDLKVTWIDLKPHVAR